MKFNSNFRMRQDEIDARRGILEVLHEVEQHEEESTKKVKFIFGTKLRYYIKLSLCEMFHYRFINHHCLYLVFTKGRKIY